MTEPNILAYFNGEINIHELIIHPTQSHKIIPYNEEVEMIEDGNFIVTREHLKHLCDEVLAKLEHYVILDQLAFILIGSDFFDWDDDRISEVLFEWNNPTINYPLTKENVIEWRNYLSGGNREMKTAANMV